MTIVHVNCTDRDLFLVLKAKIKNTKINICGSYCQYHCKYTITVKGIIKCYFHSTKVFNTAKTNLIARKI